MKKVFATAVLMGSLGSAQAAALISSPIINPANGHSYYLISAATPGASISWTEAESFASILGDGTGHLVTINDQAENDWVFSTFGHKGLLWTGLNDAANEGDFVWASGEVAPYRNWGSSEPNDLNGNEDYVHIWNSDFGTWNDLEDSAASVTWARAYGVAEVVAPVPAPAAIWLFGSALALIGGLRRRI